MWCWMWHCMQCLCLFLRARTLLLLLDTTEATLLGTSIKGAWKEDLISTTRERTMIAAGTLNAAVETFVDKFVIVNWFLGLLFAPFVSWFVQGGLVLSLLISLYHYICLYLMRLQRIVLNIDCFNALMCVGLLPIDLVRLLSPMINWIHSFLATGSNNQPLYQIPSPFLHVIL